MDAWEYHQQLTLSRLPQVEEEKSELLNIIDFSSNILKIDIWRRQKIILKIFYGIELNDDEKNEIDWLKENKDIEIPQNYMNLSYKELIIIAGRRASKSVLAALIASYEMYKLLNLYHPVQHYGLMPGTIIYALHCAAKEDQAMHVQEYFKGYVEKNEWFLPYIDKISSKEARFFSSWEKQIGTQKGGLRFKSLTSNSATMAGSTAILVILDELARMMDTGGRLSGDQIYQALTPSIATFGKEGKIIDISSPLTKSGIFYDLYIKVTKKKIKNMLCFQYATWELSEIISFEDLAEEFEKNPEWAMMEYGGEFGEVLDAAFDSDKVDKMVISNTHIFATPIQGRTYVICCDPASRNDRYGIAWGHREIDGIHNHVFIDGLKYFESTKTKDKNGNKIIKEIDMDEVDEYVISLCKKLNNVSLVAYDQGKSTAAIQKLIKRGINAIETIFTNKYKENLYNDTKALLNQGCLHVYEYDPQGAVNLLKEEMKHLEIRIKGGIIRVGHPMFGVCQTDDLYDCVSNCAHLLIEDSPKKIIRPITTSPRITTTRNFG